jgi:hypothetical protein
MLAETHSLELHLNVTKNARRPRLLLDMARPRAAHMDSLALMGPPLEEQQVDMALTRTAS